MNIIPKNFEDWKWCIEKKCGIPLTVDFVKSRLAIYNDYSNAETQRFVANYGKEHLESIKDWIKVIADLEEHTSKINFDQNGK